MKRLIAFAIVATLMPVAAYGVSIRDSIDRAIDKTAPAPKGFTGIAAVGVVKPRPLFDVPLATSQVVLWGTTWWDVDSTFRGFATCPGTKEKNRHMRSYVERGPAATWGRQTQINGAVLVGTVAMKLIFRKNKHWVARHLWVIPGAIVTGGHAYASFGNEQWIDSCPRS